MVPAVGLGGLFLDADARAHRNESITAVAPASVVPSVAPMLSVRRAPTVLAEDATRQRFRVAVGNVAQDVEQDGASCFTVSLDGVTVIEAGADRLVVPASNTKVITAAVALEVLGPDHVFTTTIKGALQDTTVQGDLFFVGGGDATLSTNDYPPTQKYEEPLQPFTSLEALADRIAATGLRTVTGRLVADESRYDTRRYNDRWQDGIVSEGEAGPLSALLVDDGKVAIDDRLPATDPAATAAQRLLALLRDRGISVGGGVAVGVAPADSPVIASLESAPFPDVLREMLTTSDDNTAELMVKELGVVAGAGGTTDEGMKVVFRTLAGWGIPLEGVELYDGSGLSNANRVRCSTLVAVLDHFGPTGALFDGLPIAATTGTLIDEFAGTPFAGLLRAKTGSLDIAKALSGYVHPAGAAHSVSLSLILNGPARTPSARYQPLWQQLAQGLGVIPEPVSSAALVPGA